MRPAKLATSIEQADAGCAVAVIEVAEAMRVIDRKTK
ncbi:hypothetical protein ABIB75_006865 [Bradyrhizobium sp. GM2.2]